MNYDNEPVAWMEPITKSVMNNDEYQRNLFANKTGDWIPLYTAPQAHPAKTLTDEEILNICWQKGITWWKLSDGDMDDQTMIEFAKAILRKAQEK